MTLWIKAPQGSDAWKVERAGCITASMFVVARSWTGGLLKQHQVFVDALQAGKSQTEAARLAGYVDPIKSGKSVLQREDVQRVLAGERVGDFSPAAKDYAFRLAVERISGEPLDEGFETWQMRRGQELEPEARLAHEIRAGVSVRPCGIAKTDDEAFGCSADGLIGTEEGSEYKCLIAPERLRTVWFDNDLSEFLDQVQGSLWVTGLKRWHFGMYCPALATAGKDFYWRVIPRDEAYIEALERDLMLFRGLVDDMQARLLK